MSKPESEPTGPPPVYLFRVDIALRLLLLAMALAALIILVTDKQTESLPVPNSRYSVPRNARFKNSPAFVYLAVALAVTCLYTLVALVASAFAITTSFPSSKLLFLLVISDALMAGVLAAAIGAGGAVTYIGLKGNSHANWNKACNVYDKFCRYLAGAMALSLAACVILVALVALSAHSLYRSSR